MSEKKKCAKWCGRGCTEREWKEAVKAGRALAKACGPGWKARIHENLGWHYSAQYGKGFMHDPGVLVYDGEYLYGADRSFFGNIDEALEQLIHYYERTYADTLAAARKTVISRRSMSKNKKG